MTVEFLCVRCARHMATCCQTSEIYATLGDLERIESHTGKTGFTEFLPPKNPDYLDHDNDSTWRQNVFREDNSRRILNRKPNGDCTFLGEKGCELPLETRPLVCRLYPYDYHADGILDDLSQGCPLELLEPGQGLVQALGMNPDDARRWHRQLYEEIQLEPHAKHTISE